MTEHRETGQSIRIVPIVTALLLVSLAVAFGASGAAAQPTLDCVGTGGGAAFVTDSGMTVYENDSDATIERFYFPDAETVRFAYASDAINLSAAGDADARLEAATGSTTCLADIGVTADPITVDPDDSTAVTLSSNASGLAYREPVFDTADEDADLTFDASERLELTVGSTGLAEGTTVVASDADDGTELGRGDVAAAGSVALELASGTHAVDLHTVRSTPTETETPVDTATPTETGPSGPTGGDGTGPTSGGGSSDDGDGGTSDEADTESDDGEADTSDDTGPEADDGARGPLGDRTPDTRVERALPQGDAPDAGVTVEFDQTSVVRRVTLGAEAEGSITVSEYDDPPSGVQQEIAAAVGGDDADSTTVVALADVSPTDEDARTAGGTVELAVDRSAVDDPDDVAVVHRGSDGSWERLETAVSEAGDEVVLVAEVDAFSLFAVVEGPETGTETGTQTTATATPTETRSSTVTGGTASATDASTAIETTTSSTAASADGPGFGLVVTLVALATAGLLAARRRS